MSSSSHEGTAALDKALDVLDAIGRSPQGLSQAELSAQLQLPRTTLYRLLAALVARDLVRRDPLRRVYVLGMRCFEYARAAYAMPDLVAAAGLELRALRDLTGETSYLCTLDGKESLLLERCDGAHSQRSASALGQRKPLHCTSQGKAMLAALPAQARDALVRELPLPAQTPHTITDRRRLQAELKLTAARGWAIDDEEIVPGVRCVGAPIVDSQGRLRGAISVAGPAFRLTRERLELLGPELVQAARRVGAQLQATRAAPAPGEPEALEGERAFRGQFPRWSARGQRLLWADTLAPAVHACAEGRQDRILGDAELPIEALLLHRRGVLLALAEGALLLDDAGGARALPGWPRQRLLASCVRSDGTLWACVAQGERWRVAQLTPAGDFSGGWLLSEPVAALAWDAEDALVAAAPESGTLYRLEQRGPGGGVRRLATVPRASGRLSGLALDAEGGIWSALHEGWSVMRFAADGSVDRVLGLPVPNPTDLAFGGPELQRLYVTTARDGVPLEALANAPLSGRLFQLPADVAGLPTHELDWPLD
ncbi:IclR family transcriptional regulator domain-containing protein [Azohydromonas caseinilytica]|uniref:Helix-turn-helix domain-containing protein n=1 Tax=Azohydromonas caseinilytica TaxID=2728836 RepID=A0A848F3Z6_9BURK|nr:IclR family transcriptional regulator C-terminal domain-containing protein [Azohydromonas caseinilytica]NML14807.1 helix-turn-helix domain-containing protein [Azohydromonas caseinilytica]